MCGVCARAQNRNKLGCFALLRSSVLNFLVVHIVNFYMSLLLLSHSAKHFSLSPLSQNRMPALFQNPVQFIVKKNEKAAAVELGYTRKAWNLSGKEPQPASWSKSWAELTLCGDGAGPFLSHLLHSVCVFVLCVCV